MAEQILPIKAFCKKCGIETDRSPSGACRTCNKLAVANYRKNNPEKIKEYRDKYQKENKEKCKESTARWREKNIDRFKAVANEYRKNNREKVNKAHNLWVAKNKVKRYASKAIYRKINAYKINKRSADWRIKNSDKFKKNCIEYYQKNAIRLRAESSERKKKNRPAYRVYEQNREARKRENGGVLSVGLSERLFKLQKGKCACCGLSLGNDFHLDHIMPIYLGGKNIDSNIQLLRAICNISKRAKHPIDYMQSKGFLL